MKNLKEYIKESILGDWNTVDADEISEKQQRSEVEKFLKENYNGYFIISQKPNKNGKFEVSSEIDVIVKNKQLERLTNVLFEFINIKDFYCYCCKSLTSLEGAPKEVSGDFDCSHCKSLTSLEGAPKKVGGNFECGFCSSLTSLEGAPKETGGGFDCSFCKSLTSLEGAPKKVGGSFNCSYCDLLKSLKDAPKEVSETFYCSHCKSLTSLEGAPKKVGGDFTCRLGGKKFTEEDVKKVSGVKGKIFV